MSSWFKYSRFIVLTCITFVFAYANVSADTCTGSVSFGLGGSTNHGIQYRLNGEYKSLNTNFYTLNNQSFNGKRLTGVAYCLDPGQLAPAYRNSSGSVVSVPYCLDPFTENVMHKQLAWLYQNAYPNQFSPVAGYTLSPTDSNYSAQATNLAARLLVYFHDYVHDGQGEIQYQNNHKAFKATELLLRSNDSYYSDFMNEGRFSSVKADYVMYVKMSGSTQLDNNVLRAAIALYQKAKDSANYNNIWTEEIEMKDDTSLTTPQVKVMNGNNVTIKVPIKVTGIDALYYNLPNLAYLKNLKAASITGLNNSNVKFCRRGTVVNTTTGAISNCQEITTATNLRELRDGSGDVLIDMIITGTSSSAVSATVKVALKMDYYHKMSAKNAYMARPINEADRNNYQRLVVFATQPISTDIDAEITINPTPCEQIGGDYYINGVKLTSWDEIHNYCCDTPALDSSNSDYAYYCPREPQPCEPDINVAVCGPNNQTTYIKEPKNIKNCIVDRNGMVDKYDYSNINQFTVKTVYARDNVNTYCKVACKEDYSFTLPGTRTDVKAGTYFDLNKTSGLSYLKLNAKRTCVTSDMNFTQFEKDLRDINQKIVEAYNTYMEYKIGSQQTSLEGSDDPGQPSTCPLPGGGGSVPCCVASSTRCLWGDYSWNYSGYSFDYDSNTISSATYSESYESGGVSGCGSCIPFKSAAAEYGPKVEPAWETVESLMRERETIMDEFDSCSDWDFTHLVDPDITYEYEEQYMQLTSHHTFEEITSVPKSTVKEFCKTRATDEYVCTGTMSSTLQKERSENRVICTQSSCTNDGNRKVPDYYNVKRVYEVDKEYESNPEYWVEHPTGRVGIMPKTNPLTQNSIGKVFPVALTTSEGTKEYKLFFNNLGQYNAIGTSGNGRLDTVVSKASNDGIIQNQNSAGLANYVCTYEVEEEVCIDCPPDYCPNGACPPDTGGLNVIYRPISLNRPFPNGRIGYNWSDTKASQTLTEITSEGTGNTAFSQEPQYSYTLDPSNIKKIRDYNKGTTNLEVEKHGFGDFSLYFITGSTHQFRSEFLDNGQSNGYFKDNTTRTASGPVFINWTDDTAWK